MSYVLREHVQRTIQVAAYLVHLATFQVQQDFLYQHCPVYISLDGQIACKACSRERIAPFIASTCIDFSLSPVPKFPMGFTALFFVWRQNKYLKGKDVVVAHSCIVFVKKTAATSGTAPRVAGEATSTV